MKISGVYFEIGDTFLDMNVKAECVLDVNEPCKECIYEAYEKCTKDNTPLCTDTGRIDNTDVKFIKLT